MDLGIGLTFRPVGALMECPTCKAGLPKASKFCSQCGAPLALACPGCGHTNAGQNKFCNQCGESLSAAIAAVPEPTAAPSGAERRQLSVMFCDLVGSVALAERLDPEDLHDILAAYQRQATKIVEAAGGIVARYQGDGILAYFGYPMAHEDDAERAITTGLQLLEAVGGLAPAPEKLRVRIGIATGIVVVGELTQSAQMDEPPIVGATPNLAARLQAIAEPDTIVIDDHTRRLTGRLFEYRDLGLRDLKGFAQPLRAWRILERSAVESRFEALHSAGLPLAGRQEELEVLSRRWKLAKRAEGQVVLLSGEAGIGKSRLTAALEFILQDEPHARLRYSCSPQHQGSALYPVISHLRRVAKITRADSDEQKFDKLSLLLASSNRDPEKLALIADLLSISTRGGHPQVELPPQTRKLQTFAALMSTIREISSEQPLLIVFEDVHWIDPTSLELIELCAEAAEHQRLLMVLTSRPGFLPTWSGRAHVTHLALNRLTRPEATSIVKSIAGTNALDERVVEQIVDRADGVPLFIEELTKTVMESAIVTANVGLGTQAIPSTLQASLLARLDRMSPVRDVIQICAAIGREFAFELLSSVYRFSNEQLKEALRQLTSAELIYRRNDPPVESYKFKHALVQDAAYGTLLRNQRKELHARIAKALEERFPERVATEPEVLAYHFSQADLVQPAIKYLQLAGQRATERGASLEGLAYFDKALNLLHSLPHTPERDQEELMLLIGRGLPLTAIGSYAAADVGENYRRAHALCRRMGTAPQIFPVLQGLYRFYLVSAELETALDTTNQLLDIANKAEDQSWLMEAHQAQAFSHGFRGELQAAQEHFDKSMMLFDPEHFRGRMHLYSTDTASSGLCLGALIAWLRGYPDRSAALTDQAMLRARDVQHPYTLAWALSFAAVLRQLGGDASATRYLAEECVALCQQHDFPFWLASSRIMRGWSLVDGGEQVAIGMDELRGGLTGWHKTGARVYAPYFTCCLAESCLVAGQPADGLTPLSEMIATVQRSNEGWWQPELYRLTGEILSKTGQVGPDGANPEYFFRKALELATHQGSRSLALRASMSLCRLWADHEIKRTEARKCLATIYGGFDEGLGTRDLRAARKTLDELSLN
jgi:class 3 adenylate cyclase/predicted ATPase